MVAIATVVHSLCGCHGVVALGDECVGLPSLLPAHRPQLKGVWPRTDVARNEADLVADAQLQLNVSDGLLYKEHSGSAITHPQSCTELSPYISPPPITTSSSDQPRVSHRVLLVSGVTMPVACVLSHLDVLIVGVLPEGDKVVLEHTPASVPRSKAADVFKHGLLHTGSRSCHVCSTVFVRFFLFDFYSENKSKTINIANILTKILI